MPPADPAQADPPLLPEHTTQLDDALSSGSALSLQVDRRRALAGIALVVLTLVAAGFAIYRQRHGVTVGLRRIGYLPALVSLLFAMAAVSATFLAWWRVLHGLGVELPCRAAARVFFVSQLGKYVPGSLWPIALQIRAGRSYGARRRTMLTANLLTLTISCTTGLVIAGVVLPLAGSSLFGRYRWAALALLVLVPLLHPRAVPAVLDAVLARLHRPALGERLVPAATGQALGYSAIAWVLFGLHLAALCAALVSFTGRDLLASIGAMALAVSLGVLFIPAPAGAGVRDVVLRIAIAAMLSGHGEALTVVVVSRVLLILADLLLAGVSVFMLRRPATVVSGL